MPRISRRALAAIIALSALIGGHASAADALKEIRLDWATYNPVSMILKQKGCWRRNSPRTTSLSSGCNRPGPTRRWNTSMPVSIDFGSTAGSAALVARINGNPIKSIYVYSRPEWTALVTTRDSRIATVAGPQGQTRRGDARHRSAYLPGAGAARCRLERKGYQPGIAAACRRQDRADPRRRRCMGWPRSDDGAGGDRRRRKAVLPQAPSQHLGQFSMCANNF